MIQEGIAEFLIYIPFAADFLPNIDEPGRRLRHCWIVDMQTLSWRYLFQGLGIGLYEVHILMHTGFTRKGLHKRRWDRPLHHCRCGFTGIQRRGKSQMSGIRVAHRRRGRRRGDHSNYFCFPFIHRARIHRAVAVGIG